MSIEAKAVPARNVNAVALRMSDVRQTLNAVMAAENNYACSDDRQLRFEARAEMADAIAELKSQVGLLVDVAKITREARPV